MKLLSLELPWCSPASISITEAEGFALQANSIRRQQLIFIAVPHENCIEFDLVEPGDDRRVNSIKHLCMEIPTRYLRITAGIEGIE